MAISDLHTDYADNVKFLEGFSDDDHTEDILIVAGDVSHDIKILRDTLCLLQTKFMHVAFVPGNHDLWVKRAGTQSSIQKFNEIQELCTHLGIITTTTRVCTDSAGNGGVYLVPLLSWHHASWDTEPNIVVPPIPPLEHVCSDFHRCKWPDNLDQTTEAVAKYFDGLNDDGRLALPWKTATDKGDSLPIVSFSHFLPYQELLPEKRMLYYPNLSKMVCQLHPTSYGTVVG